MSKLRVTQLRSRNGCDRRQLDTLRSLGLRRIGHTVEHEDTPQVRGMLHKVRHLVSVSDDAAESAGAVESAGTDSIANSPGGELAGGRS